MKLASINQIMSTRARATFSHRINFETIEYNNIEVMKEWCLENCQSLWRTETYHAIYWQFEDERDAMLFMLKFGTAKGNKLK